MNYSIIHTTRYSYESPAALSQNDASLEPRRSQFQTPQKITWHLNPLPEFTRERTDFFGNQWKSFSFEKPHRELTLSVTSQVQVVDSPDPGAPRGDRQQSYTEAFLAPSHYVPLKPMFAEYGQISLGSNRSTLAVAQEISQRMFQDCVYDPEATTIQTPVETFFKTKRGVCQDYAHGTLAVLRSIGIPARYVSGYLNTLPPPGKEKILGADASHAWVSVYCDDLGWVDMDPTNGIMVTHNHITLGWGRDYGDITPLRGVVLGGGTQTLDVEVTVLLEP
jgi:transglutaminase-like putative cysteine protease